MGVDAAGRHGWAGVVVDDDGFASGHLAPALVELIAEAEAEPGGRLDAIGIDIPIGLVHDRSREADRLARAYVGPRRSSVFSAPHAAVIDAVDQAEANARLAELGMPLVSAQAAALFPRIREAAALAHDERVIEVFPEATFCFLAGRHLDHYKKTWAGTALRLELLAAADPPIVVPWSVGALGKAPVDDVFDAAATAWSALRYAHGTAEPFGTDVDPATGRRVAMWV